LSRLVSVEWYGNDRESYAGSAGAPSLALKAFRFSHLMSRPNFLHVAFGAMHVETLPSLSSLPIPYRVRLCDVTSLYV